MTKWLVGAGAVLLSLSIARAEPFCVGTEAEFLKAKDKFPKMFQKLPVYMVTQENPYGASAVELRATEDGKFISHGYTVKKKLGLFGPPFGTEENADIDSVCVEENKITMKSRKFEVKNGVKKSDSEKDKLFVIDGDNVKHRVATIWVPLKKTTLQGYDKFYKLLEETQEFPEGYGKSQKSDGVQ